MEDNQMENLSSVKKYEFTGETKVIEDFHGQTRLLHRIRAICDFGRIKKGELGGWIENEKNLSHDGESWVQGDAEVYGDATILKLGFVDGNAKIYGNAVVDHEDTIPEDAEIFEDAEISERDRVYEYSKIFRDDELFEQAFTVMP